MRTLKILLYNLIITIFAVTAVAQTSSETPLKSLPKNIIIMISDGCGADLFKEAAVNTDSSRGNYIDNTDVAKVIFSLLN